MTTKENIYEPTTGEKKLLLVLLSPDSITMSKSDICEKAGVVRNVYYDAFAKPDFVAHYRQLARDLISEAVMPVINSTLKEAKKGSFQHQKLILEMASMHQDSMALTGNDKGPIVTINSDMDPLEAQKLYAAMIKGDGNE